MRTMNRTEAEQEYNYYQKLQSSRIRENAFEDWTAYRGHVTDFILNHTDRGKTIAVFGAGRCCDIDMKRLAAAFSNVWLIDFQKSSLLEALRRYDLSDNPNIHLMIRDFVGITEEEYLSLVHLCISCASAKAEVHELTEKLDQIYERIRDYEIELEKDSSFDYCVAIGLHSQLNDTADWICTDIAHRMLMEENFFENARMRIRKENMALIRKFHDMILSRCREKLFVGYEEGISGEQRCVQGAMEAQDDLQRRERMGQIGSGAKTNLIWPYDKCKNICFSMRLEEFIIKESA